MILAPGNVLKDARSGNAPSVYEASDPVLVAVEARIRQELTNLPPHRIEVCSAAHFSTAIALVRGGRVDITPERSIFRTFSGERLEIFDPSISKSLYTTLVNRFWKHHEGTSVSVDPYKREITANPVIGGILVVRELAALGIDNENTLKVAVLFNPIWQAWDVPAVTSGLATLYVGAEWDKLVLQRSAFNLRRDLSNEVSAEYWCESGVLSYRQSRQVDGVENKRSFRWTSDSDLNSISLDLAA